MWRRQPHVLDALIRPLSADGANAGQCKTGWNPIDIIEEIG
jgi:hypothetical protein